VSVNVATGVEKNDWLNVSGHAFINPSFGCHLVDIILQYFIICSENTEVIFWHVHSSKISNFSPCLQKE
jgi:hypothetical protein